MESMKNILKYLYYNYGELLFVTISVSISFSNNKIKPTISIEFAVAWNNLTETDSYFLNYACYSIASRKILNYVVYSKFYLIFQTFNRDEIRSNNDLHMYYFVQSFILKLSFFFFFFCQKNSICKVQHSCWTNCLEILKQLIL